MEQQDASSSSSIQASKAEESIYNKDEPLLVGFQSDTVVRVTDANHVRFKHAGLVSLAGVKTPSSSNGSSGFSECLAYAPEYKLQQLLPAGQPVEVKLYNKNNDSSNSNRQVSAVILKQKNQKNSNDRVQQQIIINQELVTAGFAVTRKHNVASDVLSLTELKHLENTARLEKKGLFQQCDSSSSSMTSSSTSSKANNPSSDHHVKGTTKATSSTTTTTTFFVAEFQPLDQKGTTTASSATKQASAPKNPGDKKGCSDFETYEDALRYYEYYYSWYGDVARLDRDGDGIPCPGLPHTQNQVLYRIKKPSDKQ